MSKKLLSVVLALALALSCFAVSAFALGDIGYESEEDAANYTQAWTLESTNSGNTYTVKVKLTTNYGVGPIQFKVLKTVNAGSITLTGAEEGDAIPENWLADVSFSDATGEVTVIPHPDEDGVNALDCTGGKYVAVLTYTVSDDAAGTLKIDVEDVKSATNPAGTLIAARMSDGNVVTGAAIVGQTVSADTDAVTIGNAVVATPELVGKEATYNGITSTGFVDTAKGYVYGVVQGAPDALAFFEATNGGYIEMTANAQGKVNGTGSVLTLYKDSTKTEVVGTWTLAVFGDVTGDGAVDGADLAPVKLLAVGSSSLTGAYVFAANVNGDAGVDGADLAPIKLQTVDSSSIAPNIYA